MAIPIPHGSPGHDGLTGGGGWGQDLNMGWETFLPSLGPHINSFKYILYQLPGGSVAGGRMSPGGWVTGETVYNGCMVIGQISFPRWLGYG